MQDRERRERRGEAKSECESERVGRRGGSKREREVSDVTIDGRQSSRGPGGQERGEEEREEWERRERGEREKRGRGWRKAECVWRRKKGKRWDGRVWGVGR
jgi:hypothetical protein